LIITEGRASEKKLNIAENEYLTYCWKQLTECDSPLVVFGHSLSPQDDHLIAAINEHPSRPLAIGLTDKGKRANRKKQLRIAALFDTEKIYFFDSATHPLGDKALSLRKKTPWRPVLKRKTAQS
jgi:hypothetical protein